MTVELLCEITPGVALAARFLSCNEQFLIIMFVERENTPTLFYYRVWLHLSNLQICNGPLSKGHILAVPAAGDDTFRAHVWLGKNVVLVRAWDMGVLFDRYPVLAEMLASHSEGYSMLSHDYHAHGIGTTQ